jgi:hypothetical protein
LEIAIKSGSDGYGYSFFGGGIFWIVVAVLQRLGK